MFRAQPFLIAAGGGANDAAVDHEIDAGFLRVLAAADEKVYIVAGNNKRPRNRLSCGRVAIIKRIGQELAPVPFHGLLGGQGPPGRGRAETIAFDAPIRIAPRFKVFKTSISRAGSPEVQECQDTGAVVGQTNPAPSATRINNSFCSGSTG